MSRTLRSGYTTGSCAAAAAKGAALMLLGRQQVDEVTIELPGGDSAPFRLYGQVISMDRATCFVVKDAGDDPDITNGAEIHAEASLLPGDSLCSGAVITGGTGVGRVTKPGLAVPPGEWAINPVPLKMIEDSVCSVLTEYGSRHQKIKIIISIPDGEERAKKTLNSRLGIIGGLSILGTTGIVRPVSAKAWTDTIDSALDVARACGCPTVVLSTGRSSEMAAQEFFETNSPEPTFSTRLPEEAYIMMGDHVAHSLRACASRGFMEPVIACQFAKLLKIACGHENTHAAASQLDLARLFEWVEQSGISPEYLGIISRANTAREIATETGFDQGIMRLVTERAEEAAARHAPALRIRTLLCGYNGTVVF